MALRMHRVVDVVHDERTVSFVLTVFRLRIRIVTRILRVTRVSHKSVNVNGSPLISALVGRQLRNRLGVLMCDATTFMRDAITCSLCELFKVVNRKAMLITESSI